jgi:hypothetical protein
MGIRYGWKKTCLGQGDNETLPRRMMTTQAPLGDAPPLTQSIPGLSFSAAPPGAATDKQQFQINRPIRVWLRLSNDLHAGTGECSL